MVARASALVLGRRHGPRLSQLMPFGKHVQHPAGEPVTQVVLLGVELKRNASLLGALLLMVAQQLSVRVEDVAVETK